MTRVSLIALGVGAYLAFAIVSFPASIAHRWFAPDALALADIEGTIWNGAVAYGGFNGIAFSDLGWQLHPAALLTGRLDLSVQARLPDGYARTDLTVSGAHVAFRDLTAATSLATLGAVLPIQGVRGNLNLALDELELVDGWPVAVSGTLRIADLSSPPLIPTRGVTSIALGNFTAQLSTAEGSGISAIVHDDGGPLELEGRADLGSDHTYRLAPRIRPRADASPELVEGLKLIAPADADGWHTIELTGPL